MSVVMDFLAELNFDELIDLTRTKKFKILVFIFWVSLALFVYGNDKLVMLLEGRPLQLGYSSIFMVRWVTWIFLTPLVIRFSVRQSITSPSADKIIKHFIFFISISVTSLVIEVAFLLASSYLLFDIAETQQRISSYILLSIHIRLLIYCLLVSITSAFRYFSVAKKFELNTAKLQAQLADAKVRALKMQIQPHFLFNAHQSVISLMLEYNTENATRMLVKLSELLRATLEISEENFISLERELSIIRSYLEIQRYRFSDRLNFSLNIPYQLRNAWVPPFILQPLVENAIQHGIARSLLPGKIEVTAELLRERLMITIFNSGPSMETGRTGHGIGLQNITARLRELFGNDFVLELKNRNGEGVEAFMDIPAVNYSKNGTV
ncbi:MAG: histidine kinase [Bacteroidetes bacterium]|nr:histidine kinase [Bacteroidota bacterium]